MARANQLTPAASIAVALVRAELSHLDQPKKVRQHRFRTPVLVGAVGMQSVAATAGLQIHQGTCEVVRAQKPFEGALWHRPPIRDLPSTRQAARHAEMVAAASTGC